MGRGFREVIVLDSVGIYFLFDLQYKADRFTYITNNYRGQNLDRKFTGNLVVGTTVLDYPVLTSINYFPSL